MPLKEASVYRPVTADFKPGPKYSYLSKIDPDYPALGKPFEEMMGPLWQLPIEQFQAAMEADKVGTGPSFAPKLEDLDIERIKITVRDGAEIELKVYKSKKVQKNAALYFKSHGGGWVLGSHEMEEGENRVAAGLSNVVVVSVDYRKAPQHVFPTAINDAWDALKWCKANASRLGINPERIIVGGTSAGGNLSAVLCILARDSGFTGIVGQHLCVPVTIHPKLYEQVPNKERYELKSWQSNEKMPLLSAMQMELFWDYYTGDAKPDVMHSPLLSDNLRGLPQALVTVAGADPLRDEGIAYAQALRAADVPVSLYAYQGIPHGFWAFETLTGCQLYFARLVDFLKNCAAGDRSML